jgi:hypothetical protein
MMIAGPGKRNDGQNIYFYVNVNLSIALACATIIADHHAAAGLRTRLLQKRHTARLHRREPMRIPS